MKKAAISLLILLYLIQSVLGQEVSFSSHFLYQSPSSKVFAVSTGDLDIVCSIQELPGLPSGQHKFSLAFIFCGFCHPANNTL